MVFGRPSCRLLALNIEGGPRSVLDSWMGMELMHMRRVAAMFSVRGRGHEGGSKDIGARGVGEGAADNAVALKEVVEEEVAKHEPINRFHRHLNASRWSEAFRYA